MTQAYDIQISGSGNSDGSLGSLIKAINGTGIVGVDCFTGTLANTQVGAGALTAHATLITALAQGLAGNSIATTKSSTVVSWGAASLSGGTDSAITASVAAGATETTQSYQWKYSTDGGVTWANATGTVSGTAFTNGTTATLTCTPTTTGLTGKLLKCTLTNSSGSTDSNSVVYTIS
jgi:hypothetical protein